jgi:hypothetical protein
MAVFNDFHKIKLLLFVHWGQSEVVEDEQVLF